MQTMLRCDSQWTAHTWNGVMVANMVAASGTRASSGLASVSSDEMESSTAGGALQNRNYAPWSALFASGFFNVNNQHRFKDPNPQYMYCFNSAAQHAHTHELLCCMFTIQENKDNFVNGKRQIRCFKMQRLDCCLQQRTHCPACNAVSLPRCHPLSPRGRRSLPLQPHTRHVTAQHSMTWMQE